MRSLQTKLLLSAVAALLITFAVPSVSLAQGRGHGRGHDRHGDRDWSSGVWRNNQNRNYTRHYDKKCSKFVNCHDARNGRWDNRGPRGSLVGNYVWRNGRRVRRDNMTWRERYRRNYYRRTYQNR